MIDKNEIENEFCLNLLQTDGNTAVIQFVLAVKAADISAMGVGGLQLFTSACL